MKLSECNEVQKSHLAWRLDNNTACGYLTAINVATGKLGDFELVDIFEKFGGCSKHSSKIQSRKVMDFRL